MSWRRSSPNQVKCERRTSNVEGPTSNATTGLRSKLGVRRSRFDVRSTVAYFFHKHAPQPPHHHQGLPSRRLLPGRLGPEEDRPVLRARPAWRDEAATLLA